MFLRSPPLFLPLPPLLSFSFPISLSAIQLNSISTTCIPTYWLSQGVNSLWQLVEPAGKAIEVSHASNKALAVDISIWIQQVIKGMRQRGGEPMPNAHIIGKQAMIFHTPIEMCIGEIQRSAPQYPKENGILCRIKNNTTMLKTSLIPLVHTCNTYIINFRYIFTDT